MAWHDILDQSQPISVLRHALAAGRVAHAYLFHGPDGVGKRAVAIELAAALQCPEGTDEACGGCRSCRLVRRMQHPDVHVLFPQPTDSNPEQIIEHLSTLSKNAYASLPVWLSGGSKGRAVSTKQASYRVSRIRERLHHILTMHAREGPYRVVVMTQADAMKKEAANAFLKLLEEPGDNTVLVLTTSRTDLLLPTIISRCQRVRFSALDEATIANVLEQRRQLKPAQALMYARMSGGSYTGALALTESQRRVSDRQVALEFLKHSYTGYADEQLALIEGLIQGGRDYIKRVLDCMHIWIRDLLLWHVVQEEARITYLDKKHIVSKFSSNLPVADFDRMARLVDEGRVCVAGDVHLRIPESLNLRILLVTLFQALRRAMFNQRGDKLLVPLA